MRLALVLFKSEKMKLSVHSKCCMVRKAGRETGMERDRVVIRRSRMQVISGY